MTLVRSPKTVLHPKVMFTTLVPGVSLLWASLRRDHICGKMKYKIPQMSKLDKQSASTPSKTRIHEKWFKGGRILRIRKF